MTITHRFLLIFCAAIVGSCLLTGGIAVYSLHQAYVLFTHATRPELIPVMAGQMYEKAVFGFLVVLIGSVALALPLGLYLLNQLSRPYMHVFENITDIAHRRLNADRRLGSDVIATIQQYLDVLLGDLKKLQDYEKEREWKNGARMLMHELKNPLTPLKLSTQNLLLTSSGSMHEELCRIATATTDVENILSCFKELVNIEFGPKEQFDAVEFLASVRDEILHSGRMSAQRLLCPEGKFPVSSERTLLKMVIVNLIDNGLHQNPVDFFVATRQETTELIVDFVTPGCTIDNPARIFRLGYSTKGGKRGFGLFLCKKISDYLDLDLQCRNEADRVVFSIRLLNATSPHPQPSGVPVA